MAEETEFAAVSPNGEAGLDGQTELGSRLAREQGYSRELRARSNELRARVSAATERSSSLAYQLRSVVEALAAETASRSAFARLAKDSIQVVPGAEQAAVCVGRRHRLRSLAATAPPAQQVLEQETKLGAGPTWEAYQGGQPVVVRDVRADRRWPAWSMAAIECGVGSVLALPLVSGGVRHGVLSLLAGQPDRFDAGAVQLGMLLAETGTLAVSGVMQHEQFEQALANRDVIGQAKGILMLTLGIDADEAFRHLTRRSQTEHVKVHELSRHIVEQALATRRRPRT